MTALGVRIVNAVIEIGFTDVAMIREWGSAENEHRQKRKLFLRIFRLFRRVDWL